MKKASELVKEAKVWCLIDFNPGVPVIVKPSFIYKLRKL